MFSPLSTAYESVKTETYIHQLKYQIHIEAPLILTFSLLPARQFNFKLHSLLPRPVLQRVRLPISFCCPATIHKHARAHILTHPGLHAFL